MSTQRSKQFEAAQHRLEGYIHVLLITTGSVASVKAPLIVGELLKVSRYAFMSQGGATSS
jgi:phosphopantothenoylcysteine decarboxylase